jgi:hypothetical protein
MVATVLLALVAWTMVVPEKSDDPLILDVRPSVTTSPGTFRVRASVERDDDNRQLEIAADSRLYYRSSTIQLDGAYAARTHQIFFTQLPAGLYRIQVRLQRVDGSEVYRHTVVQVTGDSER